MPISPTTFSHNLSDLQEKAQAMLSFDNLFNKDYSNDKAVLDWKEYQKDNWMTKCFDMDFNIKNPREETQNLAQNIKDRLSTLQAAITDFNNLNPNDITNPAEAMERMKNIANTFSGVDSLINDVEHFNEISGLSETTDVKMNALRGLLRGVSSLNTYMDNVEYEAEYNSLNRKINEINIESENLNKQIENVCNEASEKDISMKDVDNPEYSDEFNTLKNDKSLDKYFEDVKTELQEVENETDKSYESLKNEKIKNHLFSELVFLKKQENDMTISADDNFEKKLNNEEARLNALEGIGKQYGAETQAKVQGLLNKEKQLDIAQEKLALYVLSYAGNKIPNLPSVTGIERNTDPSELKPSFNEEEQRKFAGEIIYHLKSADKDKFGYLENTAAISNLYSIVLSEKKNCIAQLSDISKKAERIDTKPVEQEVKQEPAPEKKSGGFINMISSFFNRQPAKKAPAKAENQKAPEKIDNTDYWSKLTDSMLAETERITDSTSRTIEGNYTERFFNRNLDIYMDFLKKIGAEADKSTVLGRINKALESEKTDNLTVDTINKSAEQANEYISKIEKKEIKDDKIDIQLQIKEKLSDQLELKKNRDNAINTFLDNVKNFTDIKNQIKTDFEKRNTHIDNFTQKADELKNGSNPKAGMELKAQRIDARIEKCKPKVGEKHNNSPLYEAMMTAFNTAKESPSQDNYQALTDAANVYLRERNKGIHMAAFAFSKRNERLNLAKDLINFASDGLKEMTATQSIKPKKDSVEKAVTDFAKVQKNLNREFDKVQKVGNSANASNLDFVKKGFKSMLENNMRSIGELKYKKGTLQSNRTEVQHEKKVNPEIPHINPRTSSMF